MKKITKPKKIIEEKTDFTPIVNKEVYEWERKYGKVKYSPKFCKKYKISKEKNKITKKYYKYAQSRL